MVSQNISMYEASAADGRCHQIVEWVMNSPLTISLPLTFYNIKQPKRLCDDLELEEWDALTYRVYDAVLVYMCMHIFVFV